MPLPSQTNLTREQFSPASLGADEFVSLPTWKDPERVLELARLGVATRPGIDRERLDAVLATLERPERVSFFAIDPVPVSSSVERMGMEQIPAVMASPLNLAAVAYRRLWAEVEDRLDLAAPTGSVIDLTAIAAQSADVG